MEPSPRSTAVANVVERESVASALSRCMKYAAPSDQLVCWNKPGKGYMGIPSPACWNDFLRASVDEVASEPVVFLHERSTGKHRPQLVVIVFYGSDSWNWDWQLSVSVYGPDGSWKSSTDTSVEGIDPDSLHLFAGQPDPADQSHFTIGYEIEGQKGFIDGRLLDDGSVKMDGPGPEFRGR
ncbi:MAG TPA: hypothetical protein VFE47_19025 [Tepidisphaeraceae bacterium]|nr:hypothetical protein [Tepidisphaeraceae bacterium]